MERFSYELTGDFTNISLCSYTGDSDNTNNRVEESKGETYR